MAKNTDTKSDLWVEDRLNLLGPPPEWQPDAASALARLRDSQQNESGHASRQKWIVAGVIAACLTVVAFPAPRAVAQRVCDKCQGLLFKKIDSLTRLRPQGERKIPPDFSLKDVHGATVTLSAYRGKVVLLNFWATWCGGCKVEIPWFVEFADKYGPSGLAVLGVSMDEEGFKVVKPFIEQKRVTYPIVIGNENIARSYRVDAMPMTLLIDSDGRIAASHVGLVDKTAFEMEIRQLLKQVGKTPHV